MPFALYSPMPARVIALLQSQRTQRISVAEVDKQVSVQYEVASSVGLHCYCEPNRNERASLRIREENAVIACGQMEASPRKRSTGPYLSSRASGKKSGWSESRPYKLGPSFSYAGHYIFLHLPTWCVVEASRANLSPRTGRPNPVSRQTLACRSTGHVHTIIDNRFLRCLPRNCCVRPAHNACHLQADKGAVVLLLAYDSRGMPSALGSGLHTNKIASNFHVVDGASRIVFRVIGSKEMQRLSERIVLKALDLAILEVGRAQRPVKIVLSRGWESETRS